MELNSIYLILMNIVLPGNHTLKSKWIREDETLWSLLWEASLPYLQLLFATIVLFSCWHIIFKIDKWWYPWGRVRFERRIWTIKQSIRNTKLKARDSMLWFKSKLKEIQSWFDKIWKNISSIKHTINPDSILYTGEKAHNDVYFSLPKNKLNIWFQKAKVKCAINIIKTQKWFDKVFTWFQKIRAKCTINIIKIQEWFNKIWKNISNVKHTRIVNPDSILYTGEKVHNDVYFSLPKNKLNIWFQKIRAKCTVNFIKVQEWFYKVFTRLQKIILTWFKQWF